MILLTIAGAGHMRIDASLMKVNAELPYRNDRIVSDMRRQIIPSPRS